MKQGVFREEEPWLKALLYGSLTKDILEDLQRTETKVDQSFVSQ